MAKNGEEHWRTRYVLNPNDPCFEWSLGLLFGGFFHPKIEDKKLLGIVSLILLGVKTFRVGDRWLQSPIILDGNFCDKMILLNMPGIFFGGRSTVGYLEEK